MNELKPLAFPYVFFILFSKNIFTLHNLIFQLYILLSFLYGLIIKLLFVFVKFKTVIFYKKQRFFSDFNFEFQSFFSKLVETHESTSQNHTISIKRFFVQISIFLNCRKHPVLCQIIFSKRRRPLWQSRQENRSRLLFPSFSRSLILFRDLFYQSCPKKSCHPSLFK